jgi:hypothetical protein
LSGSFTLQLAGDSPSKLRCAARSESTLPRICHADLKNLPTAVDSIHSGIDETRVFDNSVTICFGQDI